MKISLLELKEDRPTPANVSVCLTYCSLARTDMHSKVQLACIFLCWQGSSGVLESSLLTSPSCRVVRKLVGLSLLMSSNLILILFSMIGYDSAFIGTTLSLSSFVITLDAC